MDPRFRRVVCLACSLLALLTGHVNIGAAFAAAAAVIFLNN